MSGAERRTVGVFGAELGERLRAALELAFPVSLEHRGAGGTNDLDAVLDLGDGATARTAAAGGLPALHLGASEDRTEPGPPVELQLTADEALDPRLRGAVLSDPRAAGCAAPSTPVDPRAAGRPAPSPPAGSTILAGRAQSPLWWRDGLLQAAALAPGELGEREALRDRLSPERSLALLPLVAFLREVTAAVAWSPPPAQATFLFDDPNLHWPTYGYLDLPALSRHAREHGYHAALATVPLDARWAHPAALAALADSGGALSLTVHGNDHDGGELGRAVGSAEATALAAQALRRVAAFERRTGRTIERVMVPPHEACSAAIAAALLRCGFEAISATLPYPWLGEPPADWLARPREADALVGWRPLERATGLPTILRHPLAGRSAAELRLRAYLDQPLVLYGHHDDLADGLGILATARAEVEAIAPGTAWSSLQTIARRSYETRRAGGELAVRPLANRVEVEVPAGVEELRVEPPAGSPSPAPRLVVDGRAREYGERIPLGSRTLPVPIALGEAPLAPGSVAPPRPRPLAVVRRFASESRDRLAPVLAR